MTFNIEKNIDSIESNIENFDYRIDSEIISDSHYDIFEIPSTAELLDLLIDKEELGLTIKEIKRNLVLIAENVSMDLNLEEAPIILFSKLDDFTYGYYNQETNCILLNENYLMNVGEMVDTLLHEIRHRYQYEHIQIPDAKKSEYDFLMADNNENYILPQDNYIGYLFQPIEADAREFALTYLNDLGYTKGDF